MEPLISLSTFCNMSISVYKSNFTLVFLKAAAVHANPRAEKN